MSLVVSNLTQNVYFSNRFFSKMTINTYLKLEILVVCREFLAFKYVFVIFSKQIWWLFIFVYQKSWKLAFKTGFSVHNIYLYLCWQVEDDKWILCSWKTYVKCAYFRFLMYKGYYVFKKRVWNICIKAFWYTNNINMILFSVS